MELYLRCQTAARLYVLLRQQELSTQPKMRSTFGEIYVLSVCAESFGFIFDAIRLSRLKPELSAQP